VQLDANDVVTAVANQRNGALNETAQLYAMLEAAKREIAALNEKVAKLENPATGE